MSDSGATVQVGLYRVDLTCVVTGLIVSVAREENPLGKTVVLLVPADLEGKIRIA